MKYKRRPHCRIRDAGIWEVLRPLLHRLRAAQNHPHYIANGNEHATLAQVITSDPPTDGMRQYLADMDGRHE